MNLETIFDDLEAQLRPCRPDGDAHLLSIAETRRVSIRLADQTIHHVVAPILATDFVAGFDENSANWFCASFAHIAELRFHEVHDLELPKLRKQAVTLEEFLRALKLPMAIQLKALGCPLQALAVLAVKDSLVFARGQRGEVVARSLRSTEFIQIIESSDRNELQEWSNR